MKPFQLTAIILIAIAQLACSASQETGLKGKPTFLRLETRGDSILGHLYFFNDYKNPNWFKPVSKFVTKPEYDAWRESTSKDNIAAEYDEIQTSDGRYLIKEEVPFPNVIDDLPVDDRGVGLYLTIEPDPAKPDAEYYNLYATISTESLTVYQLCIHRYSAAYRPTMLFAIYCDGVPLAGESPKLEQMIGGTTRLKPIARPHHPYTWPLRLNADSFENLIPDDTHEVAVVAVYCETLPEVYLGDLQMFKEIQVLNPFINTTINRDLIVVRSNPVKLQKVNGVWTPVD